MRKLTLVFAVLLLLFALATAQEETGKQPVTTEQPADKMPAAEMKKDVAAATLMVEAELCAGVEERMPTGMADTFAPDVGEVYLWCKVTGCMDTTVIHHVWYLNGEQMADVELPVRSPAWRTWSSRRGGPWRTRSK